MARQQVRQAFSELSRANSEPSPACHTLSHIWARRPCSEHEFDLAALTERTVIFSGPAAEAAREYPKNANLAATVAFAGLGLQRTMVRLVADPAAEHNTGRINAKGTFGTLTVECVNHPAAGNPKTSASTGLSLAHALLRGSEPIVI